MNIYLQSDMQFLDDEALRVFFGDHGMAHATYARLISEIPKPLNNYFDVSDQGALDAWVEMNGKLRQKEDSKQSESIQNWLNVHSSLHDAESQALGVPLTSGLNTVDFTKRDQFESWLYIHQQQHVAQDLALGL